MPRRQSQKRSDNRRTVASAPRERSAPTRRKPGATVDREALELRESGASYSAIARQLELRRATDAHRAFIRAMHSLSGEDRRRVVANEQDRLDELEVRIRQRDATEPEKVDRRLFAVGKLRAALDE